MILDRIFRRFEAVIDPFEEVDNLRPPKATFAFVWHYIRQAKLPFLAMLILGGLVALLETAMFYFIGRIVDILAAVRPELGWSGLLNQFGPELLMTVLIVTIVRILVIGGGAIVEEQIIVPGFFNRALAIAFACF